MFYLLGTSLTIRSPLVTLLSIMVLAGTTNTYAQVYKSINEQGKTVFSDKPSPEAEEVEIEAPNTAPPVTSRSNTSPSPEQAQEGYSTLTITSPADGHIIPNGLVAFVVTVSAEPALAEGHRFKLVIDGETYSTSSSTSILVASIPRGPHKLTVSIIDEEGTALKTSKAVTLFAYRPGGG